MPSRITALTYDDLGRKRTVTEPGEGTTETQYTPEGGGPVTSIKVINARGHSTITTFDPGRSLALTVTDPNGRVTKTEYDALGRSVKGWSASRSSGGKSPDVLIDYQGAIATSDTTRPAAVTVRTLKDNGTYSKKITVYDGLMRKVQTQEEAHGPGRIVTDTSYDDHGLVDQQTAGYLAKGDPTAELFTPKSTYAIPSWTKTRYDGMERPVRQSIYFDGDFRYATYTTYSDTSTYVDPAGGTAPRTRTDTDAFGRVTSVLHYSRTGSSDTGRSTTYEYDSRGNRTKITDPAGNNWSYTYDARGRMTSATDPDTGETDTWYDAADRPNKVTNSRGKTTYTEYDELGRVAKVREGSETAIPVKEFTYDTLPGALGKPVASLRHTANGDYINRVTGYDTEYRPTGRETVIPSNTMTTGVSGTYAYAFTYTPVSGKQLSVTLPAVGGLAAEKVITRYNDDGLAESTSGAAWYTSDVTYSPFSEPLRAVSGSQPARVWTTNFIDPHTGRLQRTVADRETADPHRISDSSYSYDASGTITSNARSLTDASGTTRDTQCFTYDAMGELVNAWTSNITPDGNATGCKASNGATWGPRTDYEASTGPVADAPDAATDTTNPDTSLASTLAATAPGTGTVATVATAYRQSFTFDWLGNRASMTEHDPADATKNVSYNYGYDSKQPHTVDSISSSPSGKGSSYTYDPAGNTEIRDLSNTTQNLTWTQENRLDTIADDGNKTTYVYDVDGNRLLENSATGSTLYLGETEVTTNASGTITKAARAYAQEGAPTVVRSTVNGATTGHKINVLLADHLGTATTTVELSGTQPVTRRAYKPYGEIRGTKPSSWPDERGYLGVGIDDAATGLTHIGAREYDQASGRFLSADPLIDIADPLQMNGYAYSNNSPISKSDPTGLAPILIPGSVIGGGGSGDSDPLPKLTEKKLPDGRSAIYDEYGVGHVIGGTPDNGAARRVLKYLNEDLKAAGLYTNGSNKGTGEIYYSQDDSKPVVGKGYFTDKDGKRRYNGTTSDFIKVTYENGKIVDVIDFDATSAKSPDKALHLIKGDINGKMIPKPDGKEQANNVVFVAASEAQAHQVATEYADDPRVRAMHPDSGYDSGRVFNGVTGRANPARVSPRIRGRIFGVAGSLMPFAQTNSYVRSFGALGGLVEMGKDFFDPFGFHDAVEVPSSQNPPI